MDFLDRGLLQLLLLRIALPASSLSSAAAFSPASLTPLRPFSALLSVLVLLLLELRGLAVLPFNRAKLVGLSLVVLSVGAGPAVGLPGEGQ